MKSSWRILLIALIASTTILTSCKKDEEPEVTTPKEPTAEVGIFKVEFEHAFDTADFALNTAYSNAAGEEIKWTRFDYYISNIQLVKTDGTVWSQPDSYYLVKSGDDASKLISISDVPKAEYTDIRFCIGVDSTRNVSGAQTGALDPANDMFWSWNTGYIYIKSEGTSPQSSSGSENFEYHIGGYRTDNGSNALKTLSFNVGSTAMSVRPGSAPQIHMRVDISKFFNGESGDNLSVATLPTLHMPGANAVSMAERFKHAFEFEHLHN
jgi:hypothetical protein